MSFLSWLFPVKPQRVRQSIPESSGLSRAEATRPVSSDKNSPAAPPGSSGNAQAANRKNERMARREMLYNVVRESMVRAGVLSASYKFKVLSLDARGRQFLVMMDLAREFGGQTEGLAEIEALIAQSAKARYDILVSAVYWRVNEHVAVGQLRSQTPAVRISSPVPLDSSPLPLETAPGALEVAASVDATVALGTRSPAVAAAIAAAVASAPVSAPVSAAPAVDPQRSPPRFQPIEADEVAAFKKALAAGVTAPAKVAAAAVAATAAASVVGLAAARTSGPRNITLLTGYEETEMPDPDMPMPALSGTQYGDLM